MVEKEKDKYSWEILSDRNRIMAKKDLEATNARWNHMMYNGFPGSDDE